FGRAVTEYLLGALVPGLDDAVQVLADDRVVRGANDRREPRGVARKIFGGPARVTFARQRGFAFLFGAMARADVARDHHQPLDAAVHAEDRADGRFPPARFSLGGGTVHFEDMRAARGGFRDRRIHGVTTFRRQQVGPVTALDRRSRIELKQAASGRVHAEYAALQVQHLDAIRTGFQHRAVEAETLAQLGSDSRALQVRRHLLRAEIEQAQVPRGRLEWTIEVQREHRRDFAVFVQHRRGHRRAQVQRGGFARERGETRREIEIHHQYAAAFAQGGGACGDAFPVDVAERVEIFLRQSDGADQLQTGAGTQLRGGAGRAHQVGRGLHG